MAVVLPVQTRRDEIVDQLIRVHTTDLVKRLRRVLGQGAQAEEVAQDAYERLLRWAQLEAIGPEARKAVLFATAHRLAIDRLRRANTASRGVVTVAADHADPAFEPLAHPERLLMAHQAVTQLTEIIDSLPERLREPMLLRYVEELSHQAICARLGIQERNLEQRITEARALCRERMKNVGFDWLWLD
jgi:RNA polymerase sigma-70 factor, ECF subfamily